VTVATADTPTAAGAPRKPRKIFLLVGVVLAAALGIGLFTSIGTSTTSGAPHQGGLAPTISAPRLNGTGTVQVSLGAGRRGTPTVLLFFGAWCPQCHTELPPLAATVRQQATAGGPLSRVRVIGVDSEDTPSDGKAFVTSSGVTFPVAYDPNLSITSGAYYFEGDPNAVFINADGTINKIVRGAKDLTPANFVADERALIPSGK
jgi:peroxiredoxin